MKLPWNSYPNLVYSKSEASMHRRHTYTGKTPLSFRDLLAKEQSQSCRLYKLSCLYLFINLHLLNTNLVRIFFWAKNNSQFSASMARRWYIAQLTVSIPIVNMVNKNNSCKLSKTTKSVVSRCLLMNHDHFINYNFKV